MINHSTSSSKPTLYISEQFVGFEIPDKSTVDHSFHGFIDATCQRNRTIIVGFVESLPDFGIGITIVLKIFKRSNREELGRCLSN